VSAISVVTAGLTSTVYKQMILSSLAKDSQAAFYQADTASDCALYADLVFSKTHPFSTVPTPWSCGDFTLSGINNLLITQTDQSTDSYIIEPTQDIEDAGGPCFKIVVTKTPATNADGVSITETKVQAKGYNICDMTNSRTVEREIDTNYNL